MPFKLSTDIAKQIAELATDLNAHLEEHRNAYSRRSEKWQMSDEGGEVDGWLDELQTLADDLENAPEEPEV